MRNMFGFARQLSVGLLVLLAGMSGFASAQAAADPNSPAKTDVKKIGRLGQSLLATKIYPKMDTKAKALWDLKPYSYLVINSTSYDKWLAVLLQNGKTGYILKEKVAELPYDVEVPKNFSLGGTSRNSTGRSTVSSRGGTGRETGTPSNKQEMLEYSFKYIGTKYVWGGNSLTGGIDCSGFVKELFEMIDVNLPRTAAEQAKVGKPIERLEDLQPGDRLYFWDKKRGKIGHTGIFLGYMSDGGAYFIHSSSNNKGVDTDDLRNEKWRNMLVGARR